MAQYGNRLCPQDGRDFSRNAELPDRPAALSAVNAEKPLLASAMHLPVVREWKKSPFQTATGSDLVRRRPAVKQTGACWSLREEINNADLLRFFCTEIQSSSNFLTLVLHSPASRNSCQAFKRPSGLPDVTLREVNFS